MGPELAAHGHKMLLHSLEKDIWVSGMLAKGMAYEPFETQWIEYFVRPGDVVLDVGAHIGYYTLLLSRLVGDQGRVYAFEPDPSNFALLW
jgi:protein-L-isoaspartate O-methyltransferase